MKTYDITKYKYQNILKYKRQQIEFQDMAKSLDHIAMMYSPKDIQCSKDITGPINYLKEQDIYLGTAFQMEGADIVETPMFATLESLKVNECIALSEIFEDYKKLFSDAFEESGYELVKIVNLVDNEEQVDFLFINLEDNNRYDFSTAITLSSRIMMLENEMMEEVDE